MAMALVVGVDGSEQSLQALRWAIDEARLRQEPVTLVMTYSIPLSYQPYGDLPGAGDPRLEEESSHAAQQELDQALEQVDVPEGVEVATEIVEDHQPAKALTERASRDDLLVVGSRGRGGFKGLLLGSVSQQCAQHANCPVVIVHATG